MKGDAMPQGKAEFADPATMSILSHETDVQQFAFEDQQYVLWNDVMWFRVTPGMLGWLKDRIDKAKKRKPSGSTIEKSEAYLNKLIEFSGEEIGNKDEFKLIRPNVFKTDWIHQWANEYQGIVAKSYLSN